jgi:hypothetical protein
MLMQKKTLTLKSNSRNTKPTVPAADITPTCVVAGRAKKGQKQKCCLAVLARLDELVQARRQVFIQMRHGPGYCGIPIQLEDGWLTMTEVSIHGTKQTATSQSILIQIRDGAFIAHIHAVDSQHKVGVKK